MNHRFTQQSASALLTVLLTLSAVAAIMLLATKVNLNETRSAAYADSAVYARQAAQAGIDEGVLRLLNKSGSQQGLTNGYYGTADSSLADIIWPKRRGYLAASGGCGSLAAAINYNATANYSLNCPYYDLLVRSNVRLIKTSDRFYYTAQELPLNQEVTVMAQETPTEYSLEAPTDNACQIEIQKLKADGTQNELPTVIRSGGKTTMINTTVQLKIKVTQNTLNPGSPCGGLAAPGLRVATKSDGDVLTIDRGATLIYAVGHFAGVQQGMLMKFERATKTKIITDFSGTIDENGLPR